VVGEFGPSYFDAPLAPARIRSINPACKIVVSVRNPIERAYSLFIHMASYGEVPADFEKAVNKAPQILDSGHYRVHLERWMRSFPPEQLHFVVLDDIQREPQRVLDELFAFLELSRPPGAQPLPSPVNAARLPSFPALRRLKATVWQALSRRNHYAALRVARGLWRIGPARFERFRPKDQWPRLTLEQKRQLYARYEDDIRFIESTLERTFPDWHVAAGEPVARAQV
jgi:hypothetical protein